MTTQYRFDPRHSRFTARAFATGMLSFLGHDPTFTIRDFSGQVVFEGDLIANMRVELNVSVSSLVVVSEVKATDKQEIENRMRSEVLETSTFPEIVFRGAATKTERMTNGQYRATLEGTLSLHGLTRQHRFEVEVLIFGDGVRLRGGTRLRMSDYGIQPVTALAGAIRLKDEVVLSFDLAAGREAS
jgi:polyisoprenoid-binding protein YceI